MTTASSTTTSSGRKRLRIQSSSSSSSSSEKMGPSSSSSSSLQQQQQQRRRPQDQRRRPSSLSSSTSSSSQKQRMTHHQRRRLMDDDDSDSDNNLDSDNDDNDNANVNVNNPNNANNDDADNDDDDDVVFIKSSKSNNISTTTSSSSIKNRQHHRHHRRPVIRFSTSGSRRRCIEERKDNDDDHDEDGDTVMNFTQTDQQRQKQQLRRRGRRTVGRNENDQHHDQDDNSSLEVPYAMNLSQDPQKKSRHRRRRRRRRRRHRQQRSTSKRNSDDDDDDDDGGNSDRSSSSRSTSMDGSSSDDDDDDDDGGGYESNDSRIPKQRERLRPGDIIAYQSAVFVAGSNIGKKRAMVLKTDPSHPNYPIILDNGDCIPTSTPIQRIGEYYNGQWYKHPGMIKPLCEFRLSVRTYNPKKRKDNGEENMEEGTTTKPQENNTTTTTTTTTGINFATGIVQQAKRFRAMKARTERLAMEYIRGAHDDRKSTSTTSTSTKKNKIPLEVTDQQQHKTRQKDQGRQQHPLISMGEKEKDRILLPLTRTTTHHDTQGRDTINGRFKERNNDNNKDRTVDSNNNNVDDDHSDSSATSSSSSSLSLIAPTTRNRSGSKVVQRDSLQHLTTTSDGAEMTTGRSVDIGKIEERTRRTSPHKSSNERNNHQHTDSKNYHQQLRTQNKEGGRTNHIGGANCLDLLVAAAVSIETTSTTGNNNSSLMDRTKEGKDRGECPKAVAVSTVTAVDSTRHKQIQNSTTTDRRRQTTTHVRPLDDSSDDSHNDDDDDDDDVIMVTDDHQRSTDHRRDVDRSPLKHKEPSTILLLDADNVGTNVKSTSTHRSKDPPTSSSTTVRRSSSQQRIPTNPFKSSRDKVTTTSVGGKTSSSLPYASRNRARNDNRNDVPNSLMKKSQISTGTKQQRTGNEHRSTIDSNIDRMMTSTSFSLTKHNHTGYNAGNKNLMNHTPPSPAVVATTSPQVSSTHYRLRNSPSSSTGLRPMKRSVVATARPSVGRNLYKALPLSYDGKLMAQSAQHTTATLGIPLRPERDLLDLTICEGGREDDNNYQEKGSKSKCRTDGKENTNFESPKSMRDRTEHHDLWSDDGWETQEETTVPFRGDPKSTSHHGTEKHRRSCTSKSTSDDGGGKRISRSKSSDDGSHDRNQRKQDTVFAGRPDANASKTDSSNDCAQTGLLATQPVSQYRVFSLDEAIDQRTGRPPLMKKKTPGSGHDIPGLVQRDKSLTRLTEVNGGDISMPTGTTKDVTLTPAGKEGDQQSRRSRLQKSYALSSSSEEDNETRFRTTIRKTPQRTPWSTDCEVDSPPNSSPVSTSCQIQEKVSPRKSSNGRCSGGDGLSIVSNKLKHSNKKHQHDDGKDVFEFSSSDENDRPMKQTIRKRQLSPKLLESGSCIRDKRIRRGA